jgi:hypothetical protein
VQRFVQQPRRLGWGRRGPCGANGWIEWKNAEGLTLHQLQLQLQPQAALEAHD